MADNNRGRDDRYENQENPNECKSAKAIKLLREVTSLLSEGDSEPDQPAAEQIRQAHVQVGASGIVQNFRKLFAPYSVHNSTPLSSSRQTKKNYPKPKLFQTSPELQQLMISVTCLLNSTEIDSSAMFDRTVHEHW